MDIRRSTPPPRPIGIETTRRTFLALGAAAVGLICVRPTVVAADDRPEQKRLAKKSLLEKGAAWLQSQQLIPAA